MDRSMMERARDWLDDNLRPDQALILVTHDPMEIPITVTRHLRLEVGRTQSR
jgi:ABC-type molybdenum transport system ATPase subunit/photorepair protein PhrA